MTFTISRRNYLLGTAAFVAAAAMPRVTFAQDLAYKGDINMYSLVRTPPDEALDTLTKSFEAAHPGIAIKTTAYPSESYVALLTAAQQGGEPIDIMFLNGQDLRRYAVDGTAVELDGKTNLDRFRPGALSTGQVNGKTYGVPYGSIGGFPLIANAKIFEDKGLKMPETYADLLTLRDALKGTDIKVFTHPGKNIYLWPVWFFTTFGQTSGNKSVERTAEILSGKGKFTDADVVAGLDKIFQFGRDGLLTQEIFSMDTPQALAEFAAGRALFWMHHESVMATSSRTILAVLPPSSASTPRPTPIGRRPPWPISTGLRRTKPMARWSSSTTAQCRSTRPSVPLVGRSSISSWVFRTTWSPISIGIGRRKSRGLSRKVSRLVSRDRGRPKRSPPMPRRPWIN
jgi:ABC-type glycerol-3-phosphate transport system substrate-binding protein